MMSNNAQKVKSAEQDIYNSILAYIGLNAKSQMLLATTKFRGMEKFHKYTKCKWGELNDKMTCYLGHQYGLVPTTGMVDTYNYTISDIRSHVSAWHGAAMSLAKETAKAHTEAVAAGDMILAAIFEKMNMHALDEAKHLMKLSRRMKESADHDLMMVDKYIYDEYKHKHGHEHHKHDAR